jgi:Rrf2 family transcriptional regulator, iron-sulfur cluster assembly transcription factor
MMCISTKGRYATRIMVFLALNPGRTLTKTEISEAEDISPGYMQQLMGPLVAAGLVRSYRGNSGGFSLARPAETITIGDVLRATEGQCSPAPCLDPADCPRSEKCSTRTFWLRVADALHDLFEGTTVADLAVLGESQECLELLAGDDYPAMACPTSVRS